MSEQAPNTDAIDVNQGKKDIKDNQYYINLQKKLSLSNAGMNDLLQKQKQVTKVQMPDTLDKVEVGQANKSMFNWKTVTNKQGAEELELDLVSRDNFHTSVLTGENSLGIINALGLRIDMREKMQSFIDKYVKNYVQSRSHNLMVAKFAQFNVAITGQILSVLGMQPEQIEKLQKEAIKAAVEENIQMFSENEYNSEMIHIVGANSREIMAQDKVLDEMRTQFVTHMQRLGNPNLYSDIKIKEIQIEQLKNIVTAFYEEKNNLEFQLNFM